jgi:hypothetical protein
MYKKAFSLQINIHGKSNNVKRQFNCSERVIAQHIIIYRGLHLTVAENIIISTDKMEKEHLEVLGSHFISQKTRYTITTQNS